MPKTKISEYSATANSNTDVASINIDEGCAPSGINNAIRAVMGHLKDFQQGTNGDPFNGPVNGTVGATTPSTGAFTTLSASSTVTLSGGTANGVAYLNGSKVVTTGSALTFDGSALTVSASVAGASLTSSGAYSYLAFNNSGGATKAGLILTNSSGILQSRAETLAWTNYDASSEYMRLTSTGLKTKTTISVGDATPSTSGAGITFPATQSASSNANTLDDYEEGTFTPTIQGGTTAGTATYTSQVGKYTKIGNVVYFDISLYWNSGTGTGAIKIAGLPFQNTAGGNMGFGSDNLALTANYFASFAQVLGLQTNIEFYQTPVGGGGLANINYDAAANIWVSGFYFTST